MSGTISVFRSPESEAQYNAAYEADLKQWPVPYKELFAPTRFGDTHLIASGPKDAAFAQLRAISAITGGSRHWSPTVFSDEGGKICLA